MRNHAAVRKQPHHMWVALQSVRTQETVPLLKAAKRVVLLTGTPALSRPKELFSQLTALAPSAKLKMKDFGDRYCQCDRYRPYGGQYDGKRPVQESIQNMSGVKLCVLQRQKYGALMPCIRLHSCM